LRFEGGIDMTGSLWNIRLDDGVLGSLTPPDEIVEAQCKHLGSLTNWQIIARISPYRGYDEYSETPDDKFEHEFFLTSKFTPNYKFTVLYITYGIEYYPLTIELDGEISKELGTGGKLSFDKPTITVNSEEEFTSTLAKIINSEKVKKVINALYSMIKSQERRRGFISPTKIDAYDDMPC